MSSGSVVFRSDFISFSLDMSDIYWLPDNHEYSHHIIYRTTTGSWLASRLFLLKSNGLVMHRQDSRLFETHEDREWRALKD